MPETVVEGALNGARAAAQLIDMRRHHGFSLTRFRFPASKHTLLAQRWSNAVVWLANRGMQTLAQ